MSTLLDSDYDAIGKRRVFLFVHSFIDELGLSPVQFRLFAHIVRREQLTASPKTTMRICGISKRTYWKTIADLERFGMIYRQGRTGTTNVIEATPPEDWKLDLIRNRPRRNVDSLSGPGSNVSPVDKGMVKATDMAPRQVANCSAGDVNSNPTGDANSTPGDDSLNGLQSISHKGNPDKLIQERSSIESSQRLSIDAKVKALLEAFPVKRAWSGTEDAVKAALKQVPFETLMERIHAYTEHTKDSHSGKTLWAQVWFDQEYYNLPPDLWIPGHEKR